MNGGIPRRPVLRSLLAYFSLTYLLSWSLWAAAAALTSGTASPTSQLSALGALLYLPGTIMPALVALAFTARAEGRVGVQALLRPIFEAPVGLRWYLFAISYMAVIKLAVALVHRLLTGAWPAFGDTPWYLMALAIVFSTPAQAGEEVGWRGYALPRLSSRLGLPRAGILLGVLWACWHLPLSVIPGTDNYGKSFWAYLLAVTALSVAMAWLYWRTGGSLLITMLMHSAVNNTAGIVSSPASPTGDSFTLNAPLVAWLTAALLGIGALYFLVRMRGVTLKDGWRAVTGPNGPRQPITACE